jgi:hypothetical protein
MGESSSSSSPPDLSLCHGVPQRSTDQGKYLPHYMVQYSRSQPSYTCDCENLIFHLYSLCWNFDILFNIFPSPVDVCIVIHVSQSCRPVWDSDLILFANSIFYVTCLLTNSLSVNFLLTKHCSLSREPLQELDIMHTWVLSFIY